MSYPVLLTTDQAKALAGAQTVEGECGFFFAHAAQARADGLPLIPTFGSEPAGRAVVPLA